MKQNAGAVLAGCAAGVAAHMLGCILIVPVSRRTAPQKIVAKSSGLHTSRPKRRLMNRVSELLKYLIPLPIPASIYGLIILFALLKSGALKLSQIEDVGGLLLESGRH